MKTRLVHRLLLACAVAVAAALGSTWWSLRSLEASEQTAERLAERSEHGLALSADLQTVVREKSFLADFLLSGDESLTAALQPHRERFHRWIEAMEGFVRTDEERDLVDRMRRRYAAYTTTADQVVELQRTGHAEAARERYGSMAREVEQLLDEGQTLLTLAAEQMRLRRATAQADVDRGRRIVLWLTGIGAICSLGLAAALARYAAKPLNRMILRLGAAGVGEPIAVDGDEVSAIEAHVNQLLERVRRQERALQQAEKLSELGELASELAHETLNPLTGVTSMLQALRRTSLSPAQLSAELRDMERLLGRVADTVRRLMSYARPLEPHMRRVAVDALVRDAVATVSRMPAAREREIHQDPTAAANLEWTLDPDLIEQVLVNLLANGCEASNAGGRIEIAAERVDGNLAFVVRDHGAGIAPPHRERLFHPFFTTKPHGNGLGLAVSRNIVREHGGHIQVATPADGGSIFRVVLPRAVEA